MRNVKVYQLPSRLGRGAALRMGVEKARGNIIAFFPADAEYPASNLPSMVSPIVRSDAKAVFGTRVVRSVDLEAHLRQIYQNNRRLYLTSKYGGMALSLMSHLNTSSVQIWIRAGGSGELAGADFKLRPARVSGRLEQISISSVQNRVLG